MALTDGLIAKYDLNTNANDSVGSNNGTLVGSPTFATGEGRTALDVNGTSQYASIPYSADLVPANITVSTWVKFDVIDNTYDSIVWQAGSDSVENASYCFRRYRSGITNGNIMRFIIVTTNEGKGLFSNQVAEANRWYHLVGTYDGTTAKFYVDGILNTSEALTGDVKQYPGNSLDFGRHPYQSNENLNGKVDDTRIWNRALSASEVTELHAESLALGLVAKYDLNTNANDSVGSNNGTLQGDAAFATDGDRTVLTLDGNGDYVDVGATLIDGLSEYTISSWVKFDQFHNWSGIVYSRDTTAMGMEQTNTQKIRFYISGDGKSRFTDSTSTLNTGEWYHLVGTWDGTDTKIYINGASEGTPAGVGPFTGAANQTANMFIGLDNYPPDGTRYHDGSIDDVRIWNRALSASEVATLHSTTAATSDALVKHLKFDGNDTGMTLSGGAALATVDGRTTLAHSGANSGNYTDISSVIPSLSASEISVSMWFKKISSSVSGVLLGWYEDDSNRGYLHLTSAGGVGINNKLNGSWQGDNNYTTSNPVYTESLWHHLAFTTDGTGIKLYINGQEVALGNPIIQNSPIASGLTLNKLIVGGTWFGGSIWQSIIFDGNIDDVRIYNKALTQTEIQSIMTGYDTPDTTAPVITVLGDNPATVNAGATYTDAGATALDANDGAVAVVTTGGVTQGQNLLNGISAHLPMDGDLSVIGSSGITSVSGHQTVNTADYIMGDRSLSFTGGQLTNIGNLGATPDQGTISFWIKPSSTAGIGNPMSTNGQSGNNAIRFEFNWQNKNKLGVYVGNGSTYSGASFGDDNSMSAGNWYLITFTWDKTEGASGTARAYKDGVLESTHTTINDFLPNNLNNVVLGGGFSGAGERYYNGLMNGLAIHSRALSDEDITYMYNAGAGRSQFTDVAGAQAGTHTVTYTATDAASNEATATRTVNVIVPDDWTFGNQLTSIVNITSGVDAAGNPSNFLLKAESDKSTTFYSSSDLTDFAEFKERKKAATAIDGIGRTAIFGGPGVVALGTSTGRLYEIPVAADSEPGVPSLLFADPEGEPINVIHHGKIAGEWVFADEGGKIKTIPVGGGVSPTERLDLNAVVSPGAEVVDLATGPYMTAVISRKDDFTFDLKIVSADWSVIKSGGDIAPVLSDINPVELNYNYNIGMWVASGADGTVVTTADINNWLV